MATVPGGLYLAQDGVTWHDANGKVISEDDAQALLLKYGISLTKEVEPEADISEEAEAESPVEEGTVG